MLVKMLVLMCVCIVLKIKGKSLYDFCLLFISVHDSLHLYATVLATKVVNVVREWQQYWTSVFIVVHETILSTVWGAIIVKVAWLII